MCYAIDFMPDSLLIVRPSTDVEQCTMRPIEIQLDSSGICDFCLRTICSSNKIWSRHHPSPESLGISAQAQCIFCTTLFNDLGGRKFAQSLWPLYRWNIRKLAPTRESQEIVLLTFRPILPYGGHNSSYGVIDSLPDRVFHFYKEQELGLLPTAIDLDSSTGSPRTAAQIDNWISTCDKTHERCQRSKRQPNSVPARLLDLSKIDVYTNNYGRIHVVSTTQEGIREPYVTLSHCWGVNPKFLQLTRHNLKELTDSGIDWSHPRLPQNFKDAILLARRLGVNYIWIDSLCIIQDVKGIDVKSNDVTAETEAMKEAKLMHIYYRNSFCNICAADSGRSEQGLFRQRDLQNDRGSTEASIILPSLTVRPGNGMFGSDTWRVVADSLWDSQLLGNVLYTRAWVFQERMLSPRILHFSKKQVFWECSTISACEGLPSGLPRISNTTAVTDRHWRSVLQSGLSIHHRPLVGEDDESMGTLWKNAVRQYTRCKLSWDGDKLIAIWSVAKLVKDAVNEEYQAGLWSGRLEEQLAWKVVDCQQVDGQPSVRITANAAPSWSWASVHGMIEPRDRSRGSGTLDRVYRVTNHNGDEIGFQTQLTKSRSEPYDLSRIANVGTSGRENLHGVADKTENAPKTTRTNETKSKTKYEGDMIDPIVNSDEPPKFKDCRIAIQGYLREGCLSFSTSNGKWQLIPLAHRLSSSNNNAFRNKQQDSDSGEFDDSSNLIPLEVFPDIDPGSVEEPRHCWLVVLAYSKNDDLVCTFSGVGLILEELNEATPRHFRRTGAIHFNELAGNVMARLTFLPRERVDSFRPGSEVDEEELILPVPPDNFWLI